MLFFATDLSGIRPKDTDVYNINDTYKGNTNAAEYQVWLDKYDAVNNNISAAVGDASALWTEKYKLEDERTVNNYIDHDTGK